MTCPRLSQQLIDEIIRYLHDDNRALAACSLVCQAWLHSARSHLFADAILDREVIEKLVVSKTAAIPFVRRLYLKSDFDDSQFWNEYFPLLVGFQSVRSLSLECLHWNAMYPNAQSRLLYQFTSVVRLHFFRIDVAEFPQLARIICAFPSLKTLVINGSNWGFGDLITATRCPPHSLHALELRHCQTTHVLKWLLSIEQMPPLQTVYFHEISSVFYLTRNNFLRALGPSLEDFLFDINNVDGKPISLRLNTRLRTLRVEIHRPFGIANNITKVLSEITSTHMDKVCFTFFCHPRNEDEEWDKVDKMLTQPPFSNLRRVEIACRLCPGLFAQRRPDLKAWAATHLPRCNLRGIIGICETCEDLWDFTYL